MECGFEADGASRRRSCSANIWAGRRPVGLPAGLIRGQSPGCRTSKVRKKWTV